MAQLVLLVVAAAWLAVLIPPMLRSRVENHPNSSVTDFRRQLNKLQATATPPRGSIRVMGRPLAPSPMQRPAAGGRPGQPTGRAGTVRTSRDATPHGGITTAPRPSRSADPSGDLPRYRTHGDPTGGNVRPSQRRDVSGPTARPSESRSGARQRRMNVLFVLVVTTACTLFLAATTKSTVMLYVFALAFLALCGYVYLLAQIRQRDESGWNDGWLERY